MAFDLWTHDFCLGCDKQTDGETYCSEYCRLAEFEKTSATPSPGPSSPNFTTPSYSWTAWQPTSTRSPSYFAPTATTASLTGSRTSDASAAHSTLSRTQASLSQPRTLSSSSSHASLCSMQTTSSAGADTIYLSERTMSELRAYAISFEQVRLQRRRSY